jgi:hypothetical protein
VQKFSFMLFFFSLGIGSSASQTLIQGLARAGGGAHAMLTDEERLERVVMQLCRRLFLPCAEEVAVDWGVPVVAQHISEALSGERLQVRAFLAAKPSRVALSFLLGREELKFETESSNPLIGQSSLHRSLASVFCRESRNC